MGRPQPVTTKRTSIARQAGVRLAFSLGLFVVVLGYSSYQMYNYTVQKSAHERADYLATYYRNRLMQIDRDWELQARDLKVRIEDTHLLEAKDGGANLQAYLTIRDAGKRFQYLFIEDRLGKKLFDFGANLSLDDIPVPADLDNGWFHPADNSQLYRVFIVPVWLGNAGMGRMAVFYEVDNALLFNLTTPGILLTAKHEGIAYASSTGQKRLDRTKPQKPDMDYTEEREIPWQSTESDKTMLCINAPVIPLFSKAELVTGAVSIPVLDGLILLFTLGFWLLYNTRRIKSLGDAVGEFAAQRRLSPELVAKLDDAKSKHRDEISEVATALKGMIEQTVLQDSEREQADAQRRLWTMVFASATEAILVTDHNNNILAANAAFTRLTGYTEAEVIGMNPRILSSGRLPPEYYMAMWQELRNTGSWAGELEDKRKDGTLYPKWLTISVVRGASGNITNYVGIFQDITERKATEERLSYLANNDTLTGLPNRLLLHDRLQNAISLARRTNEALCVMFLDLDNFKWVNDSLGHNSGDLLLIAVANRLKETVRSSDTVARLGGDEFVVLLPHTESTLEISQIANKIIDAVARPLDLSGHDFHVTTSMGISLYPNDGKDATTLLKHADTAMYVAKSAGKNQYRYFDADMNRNALERVELEQDLRHAVKNHEFELHYQPKLHVASGSVTAAEALIRWRHPKRGLLSPDKFIPLAEETGLISEIGECVIRDACQQIISWQEQGVGLHRVAVNLSAIQLESDTFVGLVERILEETGVTSDSIEFELTESMVLRNPDRSVVTLNRLHELGIHLSLDDFGTGYSSLSYLKRLPVDTLKIDRSFVMGLPEDTNDVQIVRMICALAKSIHLEIVAEGIETEAQREFLMQQGCDFLQGYLIAKPLPAKEFRAFLLRDNRND